MMHRIWIPLAMAALAAAGCQAPSPVAGQLASGASTDVPTQRVLADTSVPYSTTVATLAGTGTAGFMEGPASMARFNTPQGLAVDPTGTVYVADTFNMGVRAISPTGMVLTVGFPVSLGQLFLPTSVAVTPMGLAVLESAKNRVRFIDMAGTVTPFVGGGVAFINTGFLPGTYGHADGKNDLARFMSMGDIAVAGNGNMIITDRNRVRLAYPDGTVITMAGIEKVGYVDGLGSQARFNTLKGVAVDGQGRIYVVDSGNHRIRRITPDPSVPTRCNVALFAGSIRGFSDGAAIHAQFNAPTDVAVDAVGNVYVTDTGNHRIRKILTDGTVITLAGNGQEGAADGTGSQATFARPNHIAVDAAGTLYVTDLKNHKVRTITQI
jgi:sugar lactone lactonase YvrE